jgi:hypothetical protein
MHEIIINDSQDTIEGCKTYRYNGGNSETVLLNINEILDNKELKGKTIIIAVLDNNEIGAHVESKLRNVFWEDAYNRKKYRKDARQYIMEEKRKLQEPIDLNEFLEGF